MFSAPEGVFAVLVTPFDARGRVDLEAISPLVEFYLARGVHGLVTASVMGEGDLLTPEEVCQVTAAVLRARTREVPVLVGLHGEDAWAMGRFARKLRDLGAGGALVGPPRAGAPVAHVAEHFLTIAREARLPLTLLDYPPLGGALPVSLLVRLAREAPEIVAVKLEEAPTLPKITQLLEALGDRLRILGALGGLHALQELERGSDGFMTGFAFPELLTGIYESFRAGRIREAVQIYAQALPLMVLEGQAKVNIALRKEVLRQRGALPSARVRPPTRALDNLGILEVTRTLSRYSTRSASAATNLEARKAG